MYGLVNFYVRSHLCNHQPDQDIDYFQLLEGSPMLCRTSSPQTTAKLLLLHLCHYQ